MARNTMTIEAPPTAEVEAAGGAVWRRGGAGLEVLLVHRPKYGDWSLPKGKLDPGESHEDAALREVEEETGLRCRLGAPLVETRYVDRKGRSKRVCYWSMQAISGAFVENREVDESRWLPLGEAEVLLSYDRDREVLRALAQQAS